jgi:hypothetical protein
MPTAFWAFRFGLWWCGAILPHSCSSVCFLFSSRYLVGTRMPRLSGDRESESPCHDFPRCGQDQQIAETVIPSRPSQPNNRRTNAAARKHEKIGARPLSGLAEVEQDSKE